MLWLLTKTVFHYDAMSIFRTTSRLRFKSQLCCIKEEWIINDFLERTINLVLVGLEFTSNCLDQVDNSFKSLKFSDAGTFTFKNNNGPRIEPWGTSAKI